jgi:NDP-sugar pyrophosphorylase family protein
MPLCEYPILEVIVRQLVSCGFDRITMAVNHQAELIQAFFGDGGKWGVAIDYSKEDEPLGTMGPLRLIHDLPENFLVMNGDVLTDLHFGMFLERHEKCKANFTICAHDRETRNEYGVLKTDEFSRLTEFVEKPVTKFLVSMGIYAVARTMRDRIPPESMFGFDHLMHLLLSEATPPVVERYQGRWLDIGRPDDYEQAIEQFASERNLFFPRMSG